MTPIIGTLSAALKVVGLAPTIWQHANCSEPWYQDAVHEAAGADGQDSKRREIVFAACFLESYIFEWTRSVCRFERLNNYFPPKARRFPTLTEKWKEVPAKLHRDKVIPVCPRLDLSELGILVGLRNGLIHARASRPVTAGLRPEEMPVPALGEWDRIQHGWALGVAQRLVNELHRQLGTSSLHNL